MKKLEEMTEPELKEFCNVMGSALEFTANHEGVEKPLFMLLLFNDPKIAQYVSNCSRETAVQALREAADRLDKRKDLPR